MNINSTKVFNLKGNFSPLRSARRRWSNLYHNFLFKRELIRFTLLHIPALQLISWYFLLSFNISVIQSWKCQDHILSWLDTTLFTFKKRKKSKLCGQNSLHYIKVNLHPFLRNLYNYPILKLKSDLYICLNLDFKLRNFLRITLSLLS